MPVIPSLRRYRQEGQKFKASLSSISSVQGQLRLHKTLSQKTERKGRNKEKERRREGGRESDKNKQRKEMFSVLK